MKKERNLAGWISNTSQGTVLVIALVAFAFFTLVGLVQTCHIDIGFSKDNSEHVSFLFDNVLVNIVVLAILFALAVFLMRAEVKQKTVNIVAAMLIALSAAIGVWWVLSAKATPNADSLAIIMSARELIAGDTSAMLGRLYFQTYPFQTGYLLFAEACLRLFGPENLTLFQLTNVLWVVLAELGMLFLTSVLFQDKRILLLTAILLGLCIQPMFLCTFLYGTLPGMSLAIWSIFFVTKSIRAQKPVLLIPAAVLIACAILLKRNCFIVLIAEVIAILLNTIRTKKFLALVFAAVMVFAALGLPALVQAHYERRTDASFGKGTPQLAWMVTGFRESMFCSGWFNSYTSNVLKENDFDSEKTLQQNKADLMEQLIMFSHRPVYLASFLYHKIASQWNEPAFQSIWSSAATSAERDISDFTRSLSTGKASDAINAYFNQLMQFVYAALTIGLFFLLREKKERGEDRIVIPLILVGAVLYHALFEAKSQYAILYIPMMLPYAAFGVKKLSDRIFLRHDAKQEIHANTADGGKEA